MRKTCAKNPVLARDIKGSMRNMETIRKSVFKPARKV